jgi:hypothetical protein
MRRMTLVLTVLALTLVPAGSVYGQIIRGTVNVYQCSFDFSTQRCATDVDSVDVFVTADTGCWFLATCLSTPPSMVTMILGKTLDQVCGPPEEPSWFCGTSDICLQGDEVFVIHTGDGYWAKYALVNYDRPWPDCWEITYVVQLDGTSSLCPVPVEGATWGQIKALYN